MMLDPNQRLLLTQAFRAPVGYKLDFAVATTYSLDLTTLLASTLHLSVLGDDRPLSDFQNGVMLLESLRRSADRLAVFCDDRQTYVPKPPHVLYSLLERVVIPVKPPLGGVFHPKLWALRFQRPGEKPVLRAVVLSRNLTNDRSWDITLAVEGTTTGRQRRSNEGLRTLLANLPDMNANTPPALKAKVLELAAQLHSAEWQLPEGFDELRFLVLGFNGKGWSPQPSQRLAVVSPFVSATALEKLSKSTREPVLLVSRSEELDALGDFGRRSFRRCLTLQDAAEAEDGEDLSEESEVLQGLHAKVYISEDGPNTTVAIGSANATNAALDGRNVELIAELTGRRKKDIIPGIDDIFSNENLGKILEDYTPGKPPALDDAVLLAEQRLESAKDALAAAGLRLSCSGGGTQRMLVLKPGGPVVLEGIESLKAWPVSLNGDLATDVLQIGLGQEAALPDCSLAAVTGFVAFEMASPPAPNACRFVLNLPVDGLPEERLAAVVQTIVANREGFLKYLLYLLADMDEDGLPNDVLLALTGDGNRNGYTLESALPLLEEMTRALSREPSRLDSIQSLIDELVRTEQGRQMVDENFLKLWNLYSAVLKEVRP